MIIFNWRLNEGEIEIFMSVFNCFSLRICFIKVDLNFYEERTPNDFSTISARRKQPNSSLWKQRKYRL